MDAALALDRIGYVPIEALHWEHDLGGDIPGWEVEVGGLILFECAYSGVSDAVASVGA